MARQERRSIQVPNLPRPLQAITRRQPGRLAAPEQGVSNRRELYHAGVRWIDIQHPTQADVDALREEFGFNALALDDVLSRVQRPKLDDYPRDNYLFMVMHFPRFNRADRITITSEVDFFLGPGYVITIHNSGRNTELKPLLNLWTEMESNETLRAEYMGGGSELLLYHIVDRLTDYLFPMMTRIDKNLDQLDEDIFGGNAGVAARRITDYRRDLITLRRIIRPDMLVVSQLDNGRAAILSEEMQPYWSDIADHFARIWDMLSEFKEEIEGFDDTFNTLYSYRINETLRALTLISVILLPLTLISGIFGMNVDLPFDSQPGGSLATFAAIVTSMVLIAIAMLVFFQRKDWL